MSIILVLLIIVVLLPGIAVWAVSKFVPKLLWSVPVVTLIITGLLLLKDIISFSSEPAFTEKWELYLHNDSSMGLYLIYLPVSVSSVILTVIAYLVRRVRKNSSSDGKLEESHTINRQGGCDE